MLGASIYTTIDAEKLFSPFNLPATANPIANKEQLLRCREQSNRGSRVANPNITPISDNVVELLLSEPNQA